MDNCRISCQVMADMQKVYDDLIIINLYQKRELIEFLTLKNNFCVFQKNGNRADDLITTNSNSAVKVRKSQKPCSLILLNPPKYFPNSMSCLLL